MSRRIITQSLEATTGQPVDWYSDKIIKSVPAEVVSGWLAAKGAIEAASNTPVPKSTILWGCFVIGVVFTFLYTRNKTQVPNQPPCVRQMLVATVAFIIWVFALGPPFDSLAWYHPLYASLVLIGYTLFIPLVYGGGQTPPPAMATT